MTVPSENLSIRTRLLVLALIVALLPIGLLAWFVCGQFRQAEESARARVEPMAVGAADDLRRFIAHLRGELAALAERPDVQRVDAVPCDAMLGVFMRTHLWHAVLAVRDVRGDLVCVQPPTLDARAIADAAPRSGTAPAQGAFSVSGAFTVAGTDRWFTALQHPVRGVSGALVGTVSSVVDLRQLNADLLGEVPPRAIVSVIDASRVLLLRSLEPQAFIGTRPAPNEPNPFADLKQGFGAAMGSDGVPRLVAVRPVPFTDWQVVAGLPEQDAMGDARSRLYQTVVAASLLLLLAALLVWRISAAIGRPIQGLAQAIAAVAAGQSAVRAALDGPPEVRAMARQLNALQDARALGEAQLRGIFDTAVDAILVVDEEQRVVQANRAAAAMLRTSVEDIIGTPLERFIPMRSRAQHRAAMQAFGEGSVVARHMGVAREVQALRADGSEFPIEASISTLAINGQRLYTVIHRDITQRRHEQTELTQGKAKLEAALASMNDAVFIVDADGRLREFNDAFVRFLRFKDRSACPHSVSDAPQKFELRFPDGKLAPLDMWAAPRALRGDIGSGIEYLVRRLDTGESWIGSYSFAPIRAADGSVAGAVVVARDVTAAREVQADLARSHAALQRLMAAQDHVQEQERSRIARELHDDLQQILAAIRIDLGELIERLQAAASDQLPLVREVDALAMRAIVSIRRIVEDLRPQMIDDIGLVPTLQTLTAQFSRRTGITCELDAAEDLDKALKHRPALSTCLYRIAQEALNNVAKHAAAGRVVIRLVALATGQVALSVLDDGRGIRSADRRKPGSFGLQGMNERVRSQGGSLRVERLASGGTLVEAIVPLSGPPAEAANEAGDGPSFDDSAPAALDAAPMPRLLTHTGPPSLQPVIDALACSVAVMDASGIIRFVNRAWVEFAERNGSPGSRELGPGVNYLDVCRGSVPEDPDAAVALQGLQDVIAGRAASFSCEYGCHSAVELRWYRMLAMPMAHGEVMVLHVLVSSQPRDDGRRDLASAQRIAPPP